jgi:hypothetical protein
MSLGFSRLGVWLVLGCFAANGLLVGHAFAQGKPQPRRSIELSETNSAEILTNLNQFTTKKDGFRQLDDQLRSLKGISPQNTLDGNFDAPYRPQSSPALSSKVVKELQERRRNWGLTPDELGMTTTTSDADPLSTFGEGKTDSKKSSLQQFYDALNGTGPGRPTADRYNENGLITPGKRSSFSDPNSSDDDAKLPDGIRDQAKQLKQAVNDDGGGVFKAVQAHSSFENFFGLSDDSPARDQTAGPKTTTESFLNQFKKGFNSQSAGAKLDPALNSLLPGEIQRPVAFPLGDSLPKSSHNDLTLSAPGDVNAAISRAALPDVNATLLNQWNPLYTPPKLELPKVTAPPIPLNMEFPRRPF